MKILVATLDIDYAREITALTRPYMEKFAQSLAAEFHVIDQRRWPELPVTLEKFQLYDVVQDHDWVIFLDADCLVRSSMIDPDWHTYQGVWIPQSLPLTQFDLPLRQHFPTFFFAFPGQWRDIMRMPDQVLDWVRWVRHQDAQRRAWLLDDLVINHNVSGLDLPCRIMPNQVGHMGFEGCTISDKVQFLHESILMLEQAYA